MSLTSLCLVVVTDGSRWLIRTGKTLHQYTSALILEDKVVRVLSVLGRVRELQKEICLNEVACQHSSLQGKGEESNLKQKVEGSWILIVLRKYFLILCDLKQEVFQ